MLVRPFFALNLIFTFLLTVPAFGCTCTFYPLAGTYGSGTEQFEISYPAHSGSGLPSSLHLYAARAGSGMRLPDADLDLNCEGNTWTGLETTTVGVFIWIIEGVRNTPNVPPEFSSLFASAVDYSSDVNLTLVVPPMPFVPNGHTRHDGAQARSGASAPSFICNRIKNEIASNDRMIDAYSDVRIQTYAKDNHLRAHDNSEPFYLDSNNQIQAFGGSAQSPYTAENLVIAKATGRLSWNGSVPVVSSTGNISSHVGASIDRDSCDVSFNNQQNAANSCVLTSELEHRLRHEQEHENLCIQKKSQSVVTASGTTLTTSSATNYTDFTEYPANLASDELKAYREGNNFLSGQLTKYGCAGPINTP